jgi:MMP 1-O-methyltransferase
LELALTKVSEFCQGSVKIKVNGDIILDTFQPFHETFPDWFDPQGGAIGGDAEELQAVCKLTDGVEGWLQQNQGVSLYQLARRPIPGVALEIGSFCGKSTIFTALGCKQSGTVIYAVDPHKAISEGGKEQYNQDLTLRAKGTFEDFTHNIKQSGLEDYVKPIVLPSEEARYQVEPLNLKLLFIDGSHAYMDVLLDYYLWHDMVVPGGYLVFDDSNFKTVNLMIQRHVDRKRYSYQGSIGTHGKSMTLWCRSF